MLKNVDFKRIANYTSPNPPKMDVKVEQMEIEPELKSRIKGYLEAKGYEVTEGAELTGKSNVAHTFDMLAQIDDGLTRYTIAVCITCGGDSKTEVETIFHFANKAYDCGILDRVLVAAPALSQQARQLARKQRIKVIDGELVEQLLTSKPAQPAKPREPLRFGTKEELIESLVNRGYVVDENHKLKASQVLNIPSTSWLVPAAARLVMFWV